MDRNPYHPDTGKYHPSQYSANYPPSTVDYHSPPRGHPPQPGSYYPPPGTGHPPQPGSYYPPPGTGHPPQPVNYYPPPTSGHPSQPGSYHPPPATGYPPQPHSYHPPPPPVGHPPQPGNYYPPPGTGHSPQPGSYHPHPAARHPPQQGSYQPPPAAGHPTRHNSYKPSATEDVSQRENYYPPLTDFNRHSQHTSTLGSSLPRYPRNSANRLLPKKHYVPKPLIKITPNFDPMKDAKRLHKAFKGLGCNDNDVKALLTARSYENRMEIRAKYDNAYEPKLFPRVKSEMRNNRERLVKMLILSRMDLHAYFMRLAVKGIGTNEKIINFIMAVLTNKEKKELITAYSNTINRSLVTDIKSDTSGPYRDLLVQMCYANRNEDQAVDVGEARMIANELFNSTIRGGNIQTDMFLGKFLSSSLSMISAFSVEFLKVSNGIPITSYMKATSPSKKDFYSLIKTIYHVAVSPVEYFANFLDKAIQNMSFLNISLVLFTRAEIDLGTIMEEFKCLTGKTVAKALHEMDWSADKYLQEAFLQFVSH